MLHHFSAVAAAAAAAAAAHNNVDADAVVAVAAAAVATVFPWHHALIITVNCKKMVSENI